jgi:hypothetical protein
MENEFLYGYWYYTTEGNYFFTGRKPDKKADYFFRKKNLEYRYIGSVSLKREHFKKISFGVFKVI